jgi:cell division protein FtsN
MNQESAIHQEDQLAIVLGQRQLIAVCCMFLVIIGLVSTLAYVAGRSITAATFRSVTERSEPAAPAPIMVDPAKNAKTAAAAAVPPVIEARAESAVPAAPPVEPVKPSPFPEVARPIPVRAAAAANPMESREPVTGETYWQVGSIERGMAATFTQYLSSQGFRSRLAPGGSDNTIRVLVGPLTNDAEIENTGRALEAAGFQHFLRKY